MFSDTTTLVNSVMYQSGTSIGVNTAAPAAAFHAVSAGVAGGVHRRPQRLADGVAASRAARGTASSPTAVQTNDILGGFAVRGYGATGFSTGRGQVMYKAAEPWTDAAQGTYLQFTRTATGR